MQLARYDYMKWSHGRGREKTIQYLMWVRTKTHKWKLAEIENSWVRCRCSNVQCQSKIQTIFFNFLENYMGRARHIDQFYFASFRIRNKFIRKTTDPNGTWSLSGFALWFIFRYNDFHVELENGCRSIPSKQWRIAFECIFVPRIYNQL